MSAAASQPSPSGTRLVGKTAIVTGAASGIGRAITEAFVAQDARVLAVDLPGRAWPSTLVGHAGVRRCEQAVTARAAVHGRSRIPTVLGNQGADEGAGHTWHRSSNGNAAQVALVARTAAPPA